MWKWFDVLIDIFQATVDLPSDTATRIGWSQLYGEIKLLLNVIG